ncbi:MAG: hypothetical protein AAGE94_02800 [Acidobacteriota bacterium]
MKHSTDLLSLRPILTATLTAGVLFLAACGGAEPSGDAAAAPEPAPAPAASADPPGGDGLAPVTSRDAGATGVQITAPGAVFRLPGHWKSEQPSSSMRLAQASIPGDAGAAMLTVFYFGAGGGGGVDPNLQRWAGQMEPKPGSETVRDQLTYGAFTVTWIDIEGTLLPSTMGVGPTERQPDSRLLGAVVEGPNGPWFFKATGPAATLAAERDAFLALVMSARAN